MMACSGCGKRVRMETRQQGDGPPERRRHVDPTQAVFSAAAREPQFEVVRAGALLGSGKTFSTLTAAQDYARRSGGVIRRLT